MGLDQSITLSGMFFAVIIITFLFKKLIGNSSPRMIFFFFIRSLLHPSCKYIPSRNSSNNPSHTASIDLVNTQESKYIHILIIFFCSQVNRDKAPHLSTLMLMQRPHKAVITNDEIHNGAGREQAHVIKFYCF